MYDRYLDLGVEIALSHHHVEKRSFSRIEGVPRLYGVVNHRSVVSAVHGSIGISGRLRPTWPNVRPPSLVLAYLSMEQQ